ncbi:MAG: hypothetical protein ACXV2B_06310 [Halobacteriota archaeon]
MNSLKVALKSAQKDDMASRIRDREMVFFAIIFFVEDIFYIIGKKSDGIEGIEKRSFRKTGAPE